MINAYIKYWENCFDFSGCTSASDYWYSVIMNILINIIVILVVSIFISTYPDDIFLLLIFLLYGIFVSIASWSNVVRRLHDTGKSGWYILLNMIPYIGPIILLVLLSDKTLVENNPYKLTKNYVYVREERIIQESNQAINQESNQAINQEIINNNIMNFNIRYSKINK